MCEVFQSAGHRAKGGEGRGQASDQGLALSISLCSKIEPKKFKNSKFDLGLPDHQRIYCICQGRKIEI